VIAIPAAVPDDHEAVVGVGGRDAMRDG